MHGTNSDAERKRGIFLHCSARKVGLEGIQYPALCASSNGRWSWSSGRGWGIRRDGLLPALPQVLSSFKCHTTPSGNFPAGVLIGLPAPKPPLSSTRGELPQYGAYDTVNHFSFQPAESSGIQRHGSYLTCEVLAAALQFYWVGNILLQSVTYIKKAGGTTCSMAGSVQASPIQTRIRCRLKSEGD